MNTTQKTLQRLTRPKKGGYFTRQRELLEVLDKVSADYIMSCSMSTNKMPTQIIGEMVRERIAASAVEH